MGRPGFSVAGPSAFLGLLVLKRPNGSLAGGVSPRQLVKAPPAARDGSLFDEAEHKRLQGVEAAREAMYRESYP